MNKTKIHNVISLILNLLNFVLVLISILWFFGVDGRLAGSGNMRTGGASCFRFFTNDSNILCALVSLAMIPFNIRSIRTGRSSVPRAMTILKFIGTVAVTAVCWGLTLIYRKLFKK